MSSNHLFAILQSLSLFSLHTPQTMMKSAQHKVSRKRAKRGKREREERTHKECPKFREIFSKDQHRNRLSECERVFLCCNVYTFLHFFTTTTMCSVCEDDHKEHHKESSTCHITSLRAWNSSEFEVCAVQESSKKPISLHFQRDQFKYLSRWLHAGNISILSLLFFPLSLSLAVNLKETLLLNNCLNFIAHP
jgi:hypothetical protein